MSIKKRQIKLLIVLYEVKKKMYIMKDKKRKMFHKNLLNEYYDKYESHMYQNNIIKENKKKFVNYYMAKDDWDKQYHKLIVYKNLKQK